MDGNARDPATTGIWSNRSAKGTTENSEIGSDLEEAITCSMFWYAEGKGVRAGGGGLKVPGIGVVVAAVRGLEHTTCLAGSEFGNIAGRPGGQRVNPVETAEVEGGSMIVAFEGKLPGAEGCSEIAESVTETAEAERDSTIVVFDGKAPGAEGRSEIVKSVNETADAERGSCVDSTAMTSVTVP